MLPFLEVKATIKAEGNHAELPMLWELTADISGEVSCWLNLSLKNPCTLHFDKSYNLSQVYWKILVVVQSLSRVQLFAAPWTAARQGSLSITISWSLLRLMSIESVMPSNHLILCRLLLLLPSIFPSIKGSFPMSQLFISGGQSIGDPALASVLPMNIHGWLPPGLTSLISL